MKNTLAVLFVLMSSAAVAQISVSKIGVTYSFDQQLLPDQVNIHEFYGYNALERSNNFTAGINTEIKLLTRLSLRTGLLYSKKDYTGYFGCPKCYYYDALPESYSSNTEPETVIQRYLEIPAIARFYFVQKQFSLFADAGFNGSFLVQNSTTSDWDDSQVKSNNFILNAEAGVGASYTIVKFIEITITTVYRNSVTTYIYTDNMQLRAFGITGGINYRFGNVRPQ